jgi:hydrogenase 3 maturation protease
MKKVLMGIGNELKGDDAIGHMIAREFRADGWLSIPCGTVPENFTSVVRRERPELVVMLDAAEMGLSPGDFRIIAKEKLGSDVMGTHGISLRHLVSYLEELSERVVFIGVQPGEMRIGPALSPRVKAAKGTLKSVLKENRMDEILALDDPSDGCPRYDDK